MSRNANNSDDPGGADDAVRDLESWLTEHPQEQGDLADLLRLRELYQSLPPRQPDEAACNVVLSRLHDLASEPTAHRVRSRRPLWALLGGVAAILAVVLLARALTTKDVRPPTIEPFAAANEEPFAVADEEDVVIDSMEARDVAALVVGEPPVGGELAFVRLEDVRVLKCERCPLSGALARLEDHDEVPMLVSAAEPEPDDDN
jgi:hypothetical protein